MSIAIPTEIAIQLGICSICGKIPALCVDKHNKGTYFLCGDCMGETIIEGIKTREAIAEFAEKVGYEYKIYREEEEGE